MGYDPGGPRAWRYRPVRFTPAVLVAACTLTLGIGALSCGGKSATTKAPDTSKIPTATLPASLPQPKILGGGAIQAGAGSVYVVKAGDTLAGIAVRFGVGLDDLQTLNPSLDASRLSIGQQIRLPASNELTTPEPTAAAPVTPTELVVPAGPPVATPSPPVDTPTGSAVGQSYTVQEGDIPEKIAARFNISVEALLAANPGLDPTHLTIGQTIIIPPKPPG